MSKRTRIQVAAPEAGIIFDIGHEHTPWQRYSDSLKKMPERILHEVKQGTRRIRHLSPTIRGKQQIKAAKRARRLELSPTVTETNTRPQHTDSTT